MDELVFNVRKEVLHLLGEEHRRKDFSSFAELRQSLDHIKEARAEVLDFIVPPRDAAQHIDITGWSAAHAAIAAVWDDATEESTIVDPKLTNFTSSQGTKRRRIDVLDYSLLVRPIFKKYEYEIFADADYTVQQLWGICGPQGFEKSAFLECLALKRAFTDLVVWVPACPASLIEFQVALATAFYRGSQALRLTEIPYMMKSDTLEDTLDAMQRFAHGNGVDLVIILGQMDRHLGYFDRLKDYLADFTLLMRGVRVILSCPASSDTLDPVFGRSCSYLPALDHF